MFLISSDGMVDNKRASLCVPSLAWHVLVRMCGIIKIGIIKIAVILHQQISRILVNTRLAQFTYKLRNTLTFSSLSLILLSQLVRANLHTSSHSHLPCIYIWFRFRFRPTRCRLWRTASRWWTTGVGCVACAVASCRTSRKRSATCRPCTWRRGITRVVTAANASVREATLISMNRSASSLAQQIRSTDSHNSACTDNPASQF